MNNSFRLVKAFAFYWIIFFTFLWVLNRAAVSSLLLNKILEILMWPGAWLVAVLNLLGAEILMTTWHEMVYSSIVVSVLAAIGSFFFHRNKHL